MTRWHAAALLLLTAMLPAGAAELTEQDVRALVARVDEAIRARDVEALALFLAPDVSITLTVNGPDGPQVWRPGRAQYLQAMAHGWRIASEYSYRRSNLVIRIRGGRAVVTADVSEILTIQGQRIATATREVASVERIDGRLYFTAVSGSM